MSDITELIELEIETYYRLIEKNKSELSEWSDDDYVNGKIIGYEQAIRSLQYLLKRAKEE